MLSISSPPAWWLGLAVIPIVIFYFLRMRFRKQPVSSIFLWSQLQNAIRGANRLQSRTVWLLLLQLLSVIAAVLAVAEPVWKLSNYSEPGVIYLIDVSASMIAAEEKKISELINRLDVAKALITEKITSKDLPPRTQGMIFLCSSGIVPLGEPTHDRNQLLSRLRPIGEETVGYDRKAEQNQLLSRLRPVGVGNAGFNEAEVTKELQAWLVTHRKRWRAVLVTDGGLDLGGRKLAGLFAGNIETIMVESNKNNLGVTALRLLPDTLGGNRVMARFQIYNGWPSDQFTEIYLESNDKVIAQAGMNVPRGMSNQVLAFPGPVENGIYKIRLEPYPDALEADNQYILAVNSPRMIRVLLVGNDNPFLRAVFDKKVDLTRIKAFPPGNLNGEEWDLIVTDGVPIPFNLQCNLLAFGVTPPNKTVVMEDKPVSGELKNVNSSHPLMRFTDWASTQVLDGRSLKVKPEVQVLATVNEQPVVAAWEEEGRHYVIFGTDLYSSSLGLSGAFPIFIHNLLQWCVPQGNNPLAYTLTVGETKTFAEPPNWQIINTDYIDIKRKGPLLTIKSLAAGVFQWGQGLKRGVLVANPPAGEMDLTPRSLDLIKSENLLAAEYTTTNLPLGGLALGLFLICLYLEWFLWRGLPKRKE